MHHFNWFVIVLLLPYVDSQEQQSLHRQLASIDENRLESDLRQANAALLEWIFSHHRFYKLDL